MGSKLTDKNRLSVVNPELCKEWDYEKNHPLTPENVSYGSNKKVWWKCKKCEHEYQAIILEKHINRSKCKNCRSIGHLYPYIMNFWDYGANYPLTPFDIFPHQRKKVWWKCDECKQKWQANPSSWTRVSRGKLLKVCPYCHGRTIGQNNSLASTHPDIVKNWHPSKNNELTPYNTKSGCGASLWWKCYICGYEWNGKINRTKGKHSITCFNCRCLATKMPHLIKEWDSGKNYPLTPHDVLTNSHKKVWWKCYKCGHQWKVAVYNRTIGHGCPMCRKIIMKDGTVLDSLTEAVVYMEYKKKKLNFECHKRYKGIKKYGRGFICDFYFPEENKYVEVTGFGKSWTYWDNYYENIIAKRKYAKRINAKFEFIMFTPTPKQIKQVRLAEK